MIAALTVVMTAVIALALPRERNFKPLYGVGRALRSFPLHLSNPRLLATYAVGFGVLFSLVAVFTFINFRLAASPYLLGPAALGGIFVVYLGGVVMSPLAARLSNRFGRRRVMAAVAPGDRRRAGGDNAGPIMDHRIRLAAGLFRDFCAADARDRVYRAGGAGGEIHRRGAVCDVLLYRRQRRRVRARGAMARVWLARMRCDCLRGAGDDAGLCLPVLEA